MSCNDLTAWPEQYCPLTCSDIGGTSICHEPETCEPGCYCAGDLVENEQGQCVEPSECTCTDVMGSIYLPGYSFTEGPCRSWY